MTATYGGGNHIYAAARTDFTRPRAPPAEGAAFTARRSAILPGGFSSAPVKNFITLSLYCAKGAAWAGSWER